MTLHVAVLHRNLVALASDRLVTWASGEPFDVESNKTLIVACRDAVVALGYSGNAHLDNMPTDKWIAERIAGKELQPGGHGALTGRSDGRFMDVGSTFATLTPQIRDALARLGSKARPTEILAVGWQWKRRRRPRPIYAVMKFQDGGSSITRSPRYWGWEQGRCCVVDSPDGWLEEHDRATLQQSLRTATDGTAVLGALIQSIREVADREVAVGRDVLTVTLPLQPPIAIEFHPGEKRDDAFVAYSPWIITRGPVMAPSRITAGDVDIGGIPIHFAGPLAPAGLLLFLSSQRRPKYPPKG